jgi:hypothetical protein
VKHIASRQELAGLAAELGLNGQWSNLEDLDLDASVEGDAFGLFIGGGADEMTVSLWKDHRCVAEVRLADLFIWAAEAGAADGHITPLTPAPVIADSSRTCPAVNAGGWSCHRSGAHDIHEDDNGDRWRETAPPEGEAGDGD